MPVRRSCANSLYIPVTNAQQWHAPRPPTPRHTTYPQAGTVSTTKASVIDPDAPPVPPLSYWEPDTPEALTSPLSPAPPRNPFLPPPPPPSLRALFPMASPILPASPLSLFDRMLSPMTPTFLFPRTPPLPLPGRTEMSMARRHSTNWSVSFSELERAHYVEVHGTLEVIRDRDIAEMDVKKQDVETVETGKRGGMRFRVKSDMQQKEKRMLRKWKGLKVVLEMI